MTSQPGEPEGGSEPARPPARPIGRALDEFLASEGLSTVRVLASLAVSWSEVVGAQLAAHSAPRVIDAGELIVAVDHPGRLAELAFTSGRICDRVADLVGYRLVQRVKGRVDPHFGLE